MRRDVLGQLMLVTKLLNADMERSLGPMGLTLVRTQVLWELGSGPGMTQRALAERLGVTPRNVTTLIDALEETGFVERRPHPTDRRATELVLTEKGQTTFAQFQQGLEQFASVLFDSFSAHDLGQLNQGLNAVTARLEALAQPEQG